MEPGIAKTQSMMTILAANVLEEELLSSKK